LRKDVDRILAERNVGSMLLYADKPLDVNLYYLARFLTSGPTVYLKRVDEDPLMIVVPIDVERAKKGSMVRDVRSFFDFDDIETVKLASDQRIGLLKFVAAVAKKELSMRKLIYVPPTLPVMAADVLRHEGLKITPLFDVMEEARQTKEPDEIEAIKAVQKTAEKAVEKAIELIASSEAGPKDTLFCSEDNRKKVLTAGGIRSTLNQVLCDERCVAEEARTQIACGLKSADPNYAGEAEDVLRANQPIVLDVFPKSAKTLYHTDMARTIVKGRAPKQLKHMFETAPPCQGRDH
jgi:Xaa-Pro aminopeptidase